MLFTFCFFWYSEGQEEEKEERTSKVLTLICVYRREDRARCTSYLVIDLLSGARVPWFQLHPQESPISRSRDITLVKRSILPEVSWLCWKYVLPLVIGLKTVRLLECWKAMGLMKNHTLYLKQITYAFFTPEFWENKVWPFNMAHRLSWLTMLLQYQIVTKTALGIIKNLS